MRDFADATLLSQELKEILDEPTGFGRDESSFEPVHQAAVLALFRGERFSDAEILLILRSPDLAQNPGQVALPGGGIEPCDHGDFLRTALRETFEEVGIPASFIDPLGLFPPLPTVTGHFLVRPVLGVFTGPADFQLTLQTSEVSKAEWVGVRGLLASREIESRGVQGKLVQMPYYIWGDQKMWGLTALIFDLIERRYDKLFS